jgi:hypothetical protein
MTIRLRAALLAVFLAVPALAYGQVMVELPCIQYFKPEVREKRATELSQAMTRYRTALATHDVRIGKLFYDGGLPKGVYGADGLLRRGASGAVPRDDFAQGPAPTLVKLGLSGDQVSARTVWKVEPAMSPDGTAQPAVYYLVDFQRNPLFGLLGNWQIARVRAYDREDALPMTPDVFCGWNSVDLPWAPGLKAAR